LVLPLPQKQSVQLFSRLLSVNRITEGIPSTSAPPWRNCNHHQQTFVGARNPVDDAAAALGAVAPDDADSDADCSSCGVDWSAMSSRN